MEQVYIDTLNRMETEGIAGLVFDNLYQFDVKYVDNVVYFSKVINYTTKEIIIPEPHQVFCPKEMLYNNLDDLVQAFMKKYVYSAKKI